MVANISGVTSSPASFSEPRINAQSAAKSSIIEKQVKERAESISEKEKASINPQDGKATVYSIAEQKKIEITIEQTNHIYGRVILTAYANINGKQHELGTAKIDWIRNLDNGKYGSENYTNLTCGSYYTYGLEQNAHRVNKIVVEDIRCPWNKHYKGIGSALMQAAMEYGYSKNCKGRIFLDACWDSHGFYYKLGMRTKSRETDKAIVQRLEQYAGKERPYIDFGSHMMHMPEEERASWKEKIIANPIFSQTKQFVV